MSWAYCQCVVIEEGGAGCMQGAGAADWAESAVEQNKD
jgi:hypothetical protein